MSQEKNHRQQLTQHLSKTLAHRHVLAPQRFAFCFANLRILASHMQLLPSPAGSWAAALDYLEIILPLTWEVLGPLYFLRNKAHPNDSKSAVQHSLRRQTSCESWKCAAPVLPRPGRDILVPTTEVYSLPRPFSGEAIGPSVRFSQDERLGQSVATGKEVPG